ncbi:MAG: DsbA family protein [Parvibaculales bacterium]
MAFRVGPVVSAAITSQWVKKLRFGLHDVQRRVSGTGHEVYFFLQIDDPYSHLLAQLLPDLVSRYDINLHVVPVNEPEDDVAPERKALEDFSRRDAAKIAPYAGLTFDDIGHQPSAASLGLAKRALAASSNAVNVAADITAAFWRDDAMALERMALVSEAQADGVFEAGTQQRDALGHYLGGTLYYGAEWYWGIDRLPYLEERLSKSKLRHSGCRQISTFQARPAFMSKPAQGRLTVEFFPSARSPYSYLAMPETFDLPNHFPVDLVVRPVLPMVMRNLPVPRRKGMYIIADSKREANRIDVPFGRIADPVGEPVRRCYSLFNMARETGLEKEWLLSFCQMAWSEGVDMGNDAGLKKAVERAGLDWSVAEPLIGNRDWEDEMEENRLQMMASGLWGVPSYRLLDDKGEEIFATWGRDRIWLLAHEIQNALAG